jgi:phage terminase small subunit
MGRKPKHPALRVIEGNREHRPINRNYPKPEKSRPPCPIWLMAEARRAWKYICEHMEKMGILGASDQAVMVSYCLHWETAALAQKRMNQVARDMDEVAKKKAAAAGADPPPGRMDSGDWSDAFLMKTTNGNVVQSALMGLRNAALERLSKCASALGLSPTDRAGLVIQDPPKMMSLREELMCGVEDERNQG